MPIVVEVHWMTYDWLIRTSHTWRIGNHFQYSIRGNGKRRTNPKRLGVTYLSRVIKLIVSVCYKAPKGVFYLVWCRGTNEIRIMPVKSKASATPKATAPKRRRTRKTTPAAKVTVTTFKGGKVVKKETTLKRPSTRNLITPERLLKDISTRWAIHQYEIQELRRDFKKAVEFVKPYHAQAVETVKQWQV